MFGPKDPNAPAAFVERMVHARYRGLGLEIFPAAFGNITAAERVEPKPPHCRPVHQGGGGPGAAGCAQRIGTGALIAAADLCVNPAHPGTIPVDPSIGRELQFQADTASNVLNVLPSPAVRDILLADYIEELAADAVGPERVYAFLRHCFGNQSYHVTRCDAEQCDPEAAIWTYFE